MAKVVLEASDISKSFETPILSNINLKIKEGQIHVFMGKSGQGKSTLLKILCGLTAPDQGQVYFLNEPLENPEEVLVAGNEELAYVAQNFNLLPNRTVFENLKDALLSFNDDFAAQQISQLLKLLRLEAVQSQKIERLSGGEKQRLAIARALATEPAVLLLDEPFTQLDFTTRQTLLEAIKEVREELNTTVILVSHNLFEAFYLADVVHVLHNEQIIKSDTPKGIYTNPEYKSAANLLGELNVIPPKTFAKTQTTLLGIWSENIRIEADSSAGFQTELKVIDKRFMGDYYRYEFAAPELTESQTLIVKSKNASLEAEQFYDLSLPKAHLFELKPD